jgi:hypothetical protein
VFTRAWAGAQPARAGKFKPMKEERRIVMPTMEIVDLNEEEMPASYKTPEVEVRGDEAVIRVNTPEGVEERKVKLPKTTWG